MPGDLDGAVAAAADTFAAVDTAADDVALLAFTSGTTGRPKATMHFHRDVLAIADTFSKHVVRIEPDDVVIGTPPLAFTFGLGGLLVFPLRAGARDAAAREGRRPTSWPTRSPSTGPRSASPPRRHTARCSASGTPTWRACAAPCRPASTCRNRRGRPSTTRTGVKIIDGIGSTEMLHVFISAADDDIRPGATGRAVPGYQATILDEDGPAGAARHAGPARGQGPDRVPLPRRPAAAELRPARLEHHRRHLPCRTRTATSTTWPATTT